MKKLIFALTVAVLAGAQAQAATGYPVPKDPVPKIDVMSPRHRVKMPLLGTLRAPALVKLRASDLLKQLGPQIKTGPQRQQKRMEKLHTILGKIVESNLETLTPSKYHDFYKFINDMNLELVAFEAQIMFIKNTNKLRMLVSIMKKFGNVVERKQSEIAKLMPLKSATEMETLDQASKDKMANLYVPMAELQKVSGTFKDIISKMGIRIGGHVSGVW